MPTKNEARHCTFSDIGTSDPQSDEEREMLKTIDSYLYQFAAPVKRDDKHHCINCDMVLDSFGQFFGVATAYTWGWVHGEAACLNCHWPARGMHYIKDKDGSELITIRNFFLAYHPDNVTEVQKDSGAY